MLEAEETDSQCNEHGIEAGQQVVSHATPAAVDVLVNPAATQRLGDVDDAEEDEAQGGQEDDLPRGAIEIADGQTGHPRAKGLVDDYGTGILAPIAFHDVSCPDANERGDKEQKQGGQQEEGRVGECSPQTQPDEQAKESCIRAWCTRDEPCAQARAPIALLLLMLSESLWNCTLEKSAPSRLPISRMTSSGVFEVMPW